MLNVLSFLGFLIFFNPLSVFAYLISLMVSGLATFLTMKRNLKPLDVFVVFLSLIGSVFALFKFPNVYVTSGFLSALSYISFYPFVCFALLLNIDYEVVVRRLFLSVLTYGIPTMIFASLFFAPPNSSFNGYSTLPNLLGFSVNRVFFPFTGGVNHFGVVLGFCLVVSSSFYLDFLRKIIWFSGFFVLVIFVDSRGALLALSASLVFSKVKFFPTAVWIFAPFAMVSIGLFFVLSTDLLLSRDNSTLFSQREYLWALGIAGLKQMTFGDFLFGYGVNGFMYNKVATNVSNFFAYRNSIGSLHNAHLTLLYDFGLFGLLLFLAISCKILVNIRCLSGVPRIISVRCFIYLSIASATETVYSFNYILLFMIFIFVSQFRRPRLDN